MNGCRTDCAQLGLRCISNGGRFSCGDSTAPAPCDPTTFVEDCADGRPRRCRDGVVALSESCTDAGLECVAEPLAHCRGAMGPCSVEGSSCDGGRLVTCVNGGLHVVDCATAGLGCQTIDGDAFCGLGTECSPRAFSQSCDGTTLTVCNAGQVATVDCRSLGFDGCLMERPRIGCTPSPLSCTFECLDEAEECARTGGTDCEARWTACASAC